MLLFFRFLFVMFLGIHFISAQSSTDFEMRLENSFIKLYENPDVAIQAAKEIRNTENHLAIKNILAKANFLKGNYVESVRVTFEKTDAKNADPALLQTFMIAREFYQLGFYNQTSFIISPLLSSKTASKNSDKNVFYAAVYQLEAKNFIALHQWKNAQKSLLLSSEYAKKSSDIISKENQLLSAVILSETKQDKEALFLTKSLLKSLENLPHASYIRSATYQLQGNLLFKQQQYNQAIQFLQLAITPIENISFEPLKKNIYGDLMKNYLAVNNNNQYDFYKKKYTESSKLLDENIKEARRQLIELNTNFGVEKNIRLAQKKKSQYVLTISISLLLICIAGIFYIKEIQKAKALAKQIKFLRSIVVLYNQKNAEIKEKDLSKKTLFIPKEKEKEILDNLNLFEESKKFLDNNMSLATLSAQLGTNTKYLSEIINKYKDRNFNSYINELRITYAIQLLSADKSYHQYKISYIAEICGFTSHSVFTKVFKSVTGFSPFEFIQNIKSST